MVKPATGEQIAKPTYATYEHRRLWLHYGYQDREQIQIRLEPDNETIYLSHTQNDGTRHQTANITLNELIQIIQDTINQKTNK